MLSTAILTLVTAATQTPEPARWERDRRRNDDLELDDRGMRRAQRVEIANLSAQR